MAWAVDRCYPRSWQSHLTVHPDSSPMADHRQTCSVPQCLTHPIHHTFGQPMVTQGLPHARAHPRPWGDPGNTGLSVSEPVIPHCQSPKTYTSESFLGTQHPTPAPLLIITEAQSHLATQGAKPTTSLLSVITVSLTWPLESTQTGWHVFARTCTVLCLCACLHVCALVSVCGCVYVYFCMSLCTCTAGVGVRGPSVPLWGQDFLPQNESLAES